ncbi:hypothetical protein VZT92_007513 [Zoarces viviparus]|uniref:Uncharacterized protein n=1 Tax=Zoarces viviparus TaxID=48416 RepID=A0AAW1FJM5_ZOAVI
MLCEAQGDEERSEGGGSEATSCTPAGRDSSQVNQLGGADRQKEEEETLMDVYLSSDTLSSSPGKAGQAGPAALAELGWCVGADDVMHKHG